MSVRSEPAALVDDNPAILHRAPYREEREPKTGGTFRILHSVNAVRRSLAFRGARILPGFRLRTGRGLGGCDPSRRCTGTLREPLNA